MPILRIPDGKGDYSEIPALVGPAGKDGKDGAQGLKGDKGDKGDTGTQGLKGDPGLKGDQGVKGDTGDRGPQGLQGVPGKDANPVVIIGPGRPDYPASTQFTITGSEPVGSEYRSTDRYPSGDANGSRRWLYDGVAWRVVEGDTGWRDVMSLVTLPDAKPGSVCIRRINNTVLLRLSPFYNTTAAVPTGRLMKGITGFEPASSGGVSGNSSRYFTSVPLADAGGDVIAGRFLTYIRVHTISGELRVSGGTGTITGAAFATLTWVTDDQWPTSLPGLATG